MTSKQIIRRALDILPSHTICIVCFGMGIRDVSTNTQDKYIKCSECGGSGYINNILKYEALAALDQVQKPLDSEALIERVARAICRAGICGPRSHLDEQEEINWRKFEIEAKAAIAALTPAPIDVEALKRNRSVWGDLYWYHEGKGWDDCIDHLAAQGYLSANLPKIDGLDEALLVADHVSKDVMGMDAANRAYNSRTEFKEKYGKRHEYVIEQAARAYRERME